MSNIRSSDKYFSFVSPQFYVYFATDNGIEWVVHDGGLDFYPDQDTCESMVVRWMIKHNFCQGEIVVKKKLRVTIAGVE